MPTTRQNPCRAALSAPRRILRWRSPSGKGSVACDTAPSTSMERPYSAASIEFAENPGSGVVACRYWRSTNNIYSQFEHSNAPTSPKIRISGLLPRTITVSHSGHCGLTEADIVKPPHMQKSQCNRACLVPNDLVRREIWHDVHFIAALSLAFLSILATRKPRK